MKDQSQENNFQVSNMVYKIKNIKKKKKVRNIKNIELFDTLSNTREDDVNENKEVVIEGMNNGLTDEDWEGDDEVRSEKGLFGASGQGIADFVTRIYTALIISNCYFAFAISNACATKDKKVKQQINWKFMKEIVSENSGKNSSYIAPMSGRSLGINQELIDDANRIYQYLCYLESLILAYLYTYGWYYVTFYNYYKKQLNKEMIEDATGNLTIKYKDLCTPIKIEEKTENNESGGLLGTALGAAGASDVMKLAKSSGLPDVSNIVELGGEDGAGALSALSGAATGKMPEMPGALKGITSGKIPEMPGVLKGFGRQKGGGAENDKKKTLLQKMKDSVFGEEVEKCVEPSIFDTITSKKLQESKNLIVVMICFIFEYTFLILESFRWLLEELIPQVLYNLRFPPALCYILIFIILFLFNQYSLTILKNLIIDIINVNYKNAFLCILIVVVMFFYIGTYIFMPESRKASIFTRLAIIPIGTFLYGAFLIITELIRWAIMVIVAIPFGAMLCVFYVLWVSIVTNIVKFFKENVKNGIIKYIRDYHKTGAHKADTTGIEDQTSSGFFAFIDKVLLTVYNYLIYVILIFYCIDVLFSGTGNIHGILLQQVVQYFHLALLAIVFAWLYYLYIFYKRNGSESVVETLVSPPLKAFKYISFITFSIILTILFVGICINIYALAYAASKTTNDNKESDSEMNRGKLYKGENDSAEIDKPDITNKNAENNWNNSSPPSNWNTVIGTNSDSLNVNNGDASTSWNNKK